MAIKDLPVSVTLDKEQMIAHLSALGYQDGEFVYFRFLNSINPLSKGIKLSQILPDLDLERFTQAQSEGYGAYVVVNKGGHKDDQITECVAIFFEHDNLNKELQRDLWRSLGLPEPTIQVDTGGKSIHSYWVFSNPVDAERWRSLQIDLLEMADADRVLKNPSRVMRLAGCYHKSGVMSSIVSNGGKRYSYEELRSLIPSTGKSETFESWADFQKNFRLPIADSVPLIKCLTLDNRSLIESGVSEGGRNDRGFALAANLIGTADYLQSIGQRYDGNPEYLFRAYCDRCSPPLPSHEVDAIWKSASQRSASSSLPPDAVENCIKSWAWKQRRSTVGTHVNRSVNTVNMSVNTIVDTSNVERIGTLETVNSVNSILEEGLEGWEEQQRLTQIASTTELTDKAFWQLVNKLRCQHDSVQAEDRERLENLINWRQKDLDWRSVLPDLASFLLHDAKTLGIDPVLIWQYLFPAVLSLVGKRVSLDLVSHKIPAIAWTCSVAESGTGKSRAEKLVLDPLKEWQGAEKARFKEETAEYSKAVKDGGDPEKPRHERKYLLGVATIQAAMARLAEQGENGTLWARDEIAGLFKSLNQFSGGKDSEGLECLLELWDGNSISVDRVNVEDSYFIPSSRLSISGGIQPGVFRRIFRDPDDAQGMSARFCFAVPKEEKTTRNRAYTQLSSILPALYSSLNQMDVGDVTLTKDAEALYDVAYDRINEEARENPHAGIRAWLRKVPAQIGRIALALHLIECAFHKDKNAALLTVDTLQRAIAFANYYRASFEWLNEQSADTADISSILTKIWDRGLAKEGVLPRDIYRSSRAIKEMAKDAGVKQSEFVVNLFYRLAEMGKGTIEKDGRVIRFKSTLPEINTPEPVLTVDTNPQDVDIAESEVSTPPVDTDVDTVDTSVDTSKNGSNDNGKKTKTDRPVDVLDVVELLKANARSFVGANSNGNDSKPSSDGWRF